MFTFSGLCVVLAIGTVYLAGTCSGDGCPGGLSEGQEQVDGYFRYRCVNGQREAAGCQSEKGDQVPIGGTFVHLDSQVVCQKGADGSLTLGNGGCAQGGVAKAVGETWTEGNSVLSCVQDGTSARIVTVGCVEDGTQFKLDDTLAKGESLVKCKKSVGGAAMDKAGCVDGGNQYSIGQTFSGPEYWYTCTDKGKVVSGCVKNGQQLKSGDHVNEGDAAYACRVTADRAYMEPFACLGENGVASVDRRVGCFWNEGGVSYTCKDIGGGKLAKVVAS